MTLLALCGRAEVPWKECHKLDAYFARLYGLTREELLYVLDPTFVKTETYPSETFRVLRQNEEERFGEYRTARLVMRPGTRLSRRRRWRERACLGTFNERGTQIAMPLPAAAAIRIGAGREPQRHPADPIEKGDWLLLGFCCAARGHVTIFSLPVTVRHSS